MFHTSSQSSKQANNNAELYSEGSISTCSVRWDGESAYSSHEAHEVLIVFVKAFKHLLERNIQQNSIFFCFFYSERASLPLWMQENIKADLATIITTWYSLSDQIK